MRWNYSWQRRHLVGYSVGLFLDTRQCRRGEAQSNKYRGASAWTLFLSAPVTLTQQRRTSQRKEVADRRN